MTRYAKHLVGAWPPCHTYFLNAQQLKETFTKKWQNAHFAQKQNSFSEHFLSFQQKRFISFLPKKLRNEVLGMSGSTTQTLEHVRFVI